MPLPGYHLISTTHLRTTDAAFDLVNEILPDKPLLELKHKLGESKPILVPVYAQESAGKNQIPVAFAAILAVRLELPHTTDIVQINKPYRTGKSAYYRLANYPVFEGPVEKDKDYLMVDDTLTMGGTFASLRGYIENQQGRVILATALTGHPGAANLGITTHLWQTILEKHGHELNLWWKEQFGFGIDALTQGEAGHLAKAPSIAAIRERITQTRFEK